MEMKVTKLIQAKDDCTILCKELKMFCDTGAEKITLTQEQANEILEVIAGYNHMLNTLIDNASVYI